MRLVTAFLILLGVAGLFMLDQFLLDGAAITAFGKWLFATTRWLSFWN